MKDEFDDAPARLDRVEALDGSRSHPRQDWPDEYVVDEADVDVRPDLTGGDAPADQVVDSLPRRPDDLVEIAAVQVGESVRLG